MKNKVKYVRLFFSIYLILTSISLILINNEKTYLQWNSSNISQIISHSSFSFGSWIRQKIKKPSPPIKIKGETWLPPNSSKSPYKLSLNFILQSVNNEAFHQKNKVENNIPIQNLDEILGENTHTIYLMNINNLYLFNKLNPIFNFKYLETVTVTNIKSEIASLINKLKLSGYFSGINLLYKTHKKTVIFTLELEVNPIMTRIEFLNVNKLLISLRDLKEFSSGQIGYPKSLSQLAILTHSIQHWYSCRGYNWIQIQVFENPNNSSEVLIKITEGILDKIVYKLCPLINHEINQKTSIDKFIPVDFVNNLMAWYLQKGTMPTIYNVEKAMHALKETRFFYNSYYDVKFPYDTNKIEIIIHFIPYRDNESHAIIDKIIRKINPTNQTEEEIQNLISCMLKDKSKNQIQNLFIGSSENLLSSVKLVERYICGTKIISRFTPILLNLEVNKSSLEIDLGLDENHELYEHHSKVYFFQSLRYLGKKYNFINFTLNEKDYISQYNFSYDEPLNINTNSLFPLANRIFDNITLVKPEKPDFFLNNTIQKKILITDYYEFRRQGLELFFKRKFIGGINMVLTLATRLISYNNFLFKRENLLLNEIRQRLKASSILQSKVNKRFTLSNTLKQKFFSKRELNRSSLQDFKILSFRIQLPYLDDLYHPTVGNFTQLDFIQFRSNCHFIKTINLSDNSHPTELYFVKHASYFRNRPQYSNSPYHFLFFKIFIGKLKGTKLAFSLPDRLRYQKYNVTRTGYHHIKQLATFFGELIVEYHFRIFKYTNPVVFLKYVQDSSLLEEYPFPHIQGELFYSKRLHLSPLTSGKYIGVSWEFRTIISQIPPIKIEFAQKIPGRGRIYLRVSPYLY